MTGVKTDAGGGGYIYGNPDAYFAAMAIDLRPAVTIGAPIASAAGAFAALVSGQGGQGAESFLMMILPAALVAMLLVAFGLLPLWCLCARTGPNACLRFTLMAALLWLLPCGAFIAATGLHGQSDWSGAMAVLIPGLVLIGMFGTLAGTWRSSAPRSMRYDARQAPSAPAGRAASPRGPGPAAIPSPGSARAAD